jgi:hypothetical protein
MPGKSLQQLASTTYWAPHGLLLLLPAEAAAAGPARCVVAHQLRPVVVQQESGLTVGMMEAGSARWEHCLQGGCCDQGACCDPMPCQVTCGVCWQQMQMPC